MFYRILQTTIFTIICQFSILAISEQESVYVDASVLEIDFEDQPFDTETFHVFTHGRPGELLIQNQWKGEDSLVEFLQQAMPNNTRHVNLYGCNFAKGIIGRQAVTYLEKRLGVSISASDDITGINGDWDLEIGSFKTFDFEYPYNLQNAVCDDDFQPQFMSTFHSTVTKTRNGFEIWGQDAALGISSTNSNVDGNDILAPIQITPANGFPYTGDPIMMALGDTAQDPQYALLTTDSLYVWGEEGTLVSGDISNGNFQSIPLPTGVLPTDIKAMRGTHDVLVLLLNNGDVYSMYDSAASAAVGQGTDTVDEGIWYGVTGLNIDNIIASVYTVFAVTATGEYYTWGVNPFLGDGSASGALRIPTLMTAPFVGVPSQIAMTGSDGLPSYYALNPSDGKIYVLGANSHGQLGIGNTTNQTTWSVVRNEDNTADLENVVFINAYEASNGSQSPASASAITADKSVFLWGNNDRYLVTNKAAEDADVSLPIRPNNYNGNASYIENGGHTTLFYDKSINKYCYVGHVISGSVGNGTKDNYEIETFDCFVTPDYDACDKCDISDPNLDCDNDGFNNDVDCAPLDDSQNADCFGCGINGVPENGNNILAGTSRIIVAADGLYAVGSDMHPNGVTNLSTPLKISLENGYVFSGTPRLAVVGGGENGFQTVLLTTAGLYVWGQPGEVVDGTIAASNRPNIQQIALPDNISSADIVNMKVAYGIITLLTNTGDIYTMHDNNTHNMLGDGSTANDQGVWHQASVNNISQYSVTHAGIFAYSETDDAYYTWGYSIYRGDATDRQSTNTPLTMTAPFAGVPKKIIVSSSREQINNAYFALSESGELYALGEGAGGQLGQGNNDDITSWVQVKDANDTGFLTDIADFSASSSFLGRGVSTLGAITNDGDLYLWGNALNSSISSGALNPQTLPRIPDGFISGSHVANAVALGGQTTIVTLADGTNMFLGNNTVGTMGDGTTSATDVGTLTAITGSAIETCPNDLVPLPPNPCITDGLDSDGDGVPDSVDVDDDNDGISDNDEGRNISSTGYLKAEDLGLTPPPAGTFYDPGSTNAPSPHTADISSALNLPTGSVSVTFTNYGILPNGNLFIWGDATSNWKITTNGYLVNSRLRHGSTLRPQYSDGIIANDGAPYLLFSDLDNHYVEQNNPPTYSVFNTEPIGGDEQNASNFQWRSQDYVTEFTFFTTTPFDQNSRSSIQTRFNVDLDTDRDGIPDYLDLDSDNDGISDAIEGCGDRSTTLTADCRLRYDEAQDTDINGDNCPDGNVISPCSTVTNSDTDGVPDYLDTDSDGDGCSDAQEAGNGTTGVNDNDSNTYSNALSVDTLGLTNTADAPGCGVPMSGDWQDDTMHSLCFMCPMPSPTDPDTDGDGVPDSVDVDDDNDGIADIDECTLIEEHSYGDPEFDADGGFDPVNGVDAAGGFVTSTDFTSTYTYNNVRRAWGNNTGHRARFYSTSQASSRNLSNLGMVSLLVDDIMETTDNSYTFQESYFEIIDFDGNDMAFEVSLTDVNGNNIVGLTQSDFALTDPNGEVTAYTVIETTSGVYQVDIETSATGGNQKVMIDADVPIYGGSFTLTRNIGYSGEDLVFRLNRYFCQDLDTDLDNIPDHRDLDSDNDGMPDAIEACGDENTTLTADCRLPFDATALDENDCPTGATTSPCTTLTNSDTDGVPDYLDTDSDGDGCSDAMEAGNGVVGVNDNDTNTYDNALNVDSDGLTNASGAPNCGVPMNGDWQDDTMDSQCAPAELDTDGDGVPDSVDLDDDNDGILDSDENCDPQLNEYISNHSMETYSQCPNFGTGATINFADSWTTNIDNGQLMVNDENCFSNRPGNTSGWPETTGLSSGSDGNNWLGIHSKSATNGENAINTLIQNLPVGDYNLTFDGAWVSANVAYLYPGVLRVSGITPSGTKVELGRVDITNEISSNDETWVEYSLDFTTTVEFDRIEFQSLSMPANSSQLSYMYFDDLRLRAQCNNDIDGDGIPNSLDLDSDGDGCADAIEGAGSYTLSNLVTDTNIGGGNSGAGYTGSSTDPIQQNLGQSSNPEGTPTAGTTQEVGDSQDGSFNLCTYCTVGLDTDDDGITDICDLDDDNDGILDSDENCDPQLNEYLSNHSMETYSQCPNFGIGATINFADSWITNIDNGQLMVNDENCFSNRPSNLSSWPETTGLSSGSDGNNWLGIHSLSATNGENAINTLMQTLPIGDYNLTFDGAYVSAASVYLSPGVLRVSGITPSGTKIELGRVGVDNEISSNDETWVEYSLDFTTTEEFDRIEFQALSTPENGSDRRSYMYFDDLRLRAQCNNDIDGDGIPNSLDLDSDGDGCADAIEGAGNYTSSNLVTDTNIGGGNSGAGYTGSSTDPIQQNLGQSSNPDGTPTAGVTQEVGDSQDGSLNICTNCTVGLDADSDGLTDCEETTGIDDPSTPLDPADFGVTPTNPSDETDGCDPVGINMTDTDGDGLTDCEETTGIDDPSTPSMPTRVSDPNDACDPGTADTTDTDGDGVPDSVDVDDDNDGIPDDVECSSQELFNINIGEVLASPNGEVVLPNGVLMTVKTAKTFPAIAPLAGHATTGEDPASLGGILNGIDNLGDGSQGTANTLPSFDGSDNPIDYTRLSGVTAPVDEDPPVSTRISNPNDDFKRALGFYVEFSEPIEMEEFLLLDIDGRDVTREFATSFAFNGNNLVLPTISVNDGGIQPVVVTTLTDNTAGLNRYNNILVPNSEYSGTTDREDITALDFARTNPTRNVSPDETNTDPDNLNSQANFEYNTAITELYFLWGIEGDGLNFVGGQSSGISALVLDLCKDTDGDGYSDSVDLDSDNDGIPDAIEGCGDENTTLTAECRLPFDATALDESGCPTGATTSPCAALSNSDTDGVPDYLDTDSDGDGCSDVQEAGNGTIGVNDNSTNSYDNALSVDTLGLTNTADAPGCGVPMSGDWQDDTISIACITDAEDDINQTPQDVPVSGNLLTNDSDPQGDVQMVTSITLPDGTVVPVDAVDGSGIQTIPGVGTIEVGPDGSYTFDPVPDFVGDVPTIGYTIEDATGATAVAMLDIDVIPSDDPATNQPPVANDDTNSTDQDVPVSGNLIDANDSDPDTPQDSLVVTQITLPDGTVVPVDAVNGSGVQTIPGVGTIEVGPDGSYTFDPVPDFTGETPAIGYTISDPEGGTDDANLVIDVFADPDNTINNTYANDDANIGSVDEQQSGNIITNDNDPEGDDQVVGRIDTDGDGIVDTDVVIGTTITFPDTDGDGEMGTLVVNPDGSYVYTPEPGFVGTIPVVYETTDAGDPDVVLGEESTDTATLYLTTLPETDAEDDINQTPQDVPVSGNLLTNDNDPQGDVQMVTSITLPDGTVVPVDAVDGSGIQTIPGVGTIEVGPDGSYTFDPEPDFVGDVPTIGYTIEDATGATAVAMLDIDVIPSDDPATNQPPVANDDTNSTDQDVPVSGNLIDANDSDPDTPQDSLVVTQITLPDGTVVPVDAVNGSGVQTIPGVGTIEVGPDGSYTFDPDPDFTGETPAIGYTISDPEGGTDDANLVIDVFADPDDTINNTYANDDASIDLQDIPQSTVVLGNDNDPEGDTQTLTSATVVGPDGTQTEVSEDSNTPTVVYEEDPANPGTYVQVGVAYINTTTGEIFFDPDPDFIGTAPIIYEIVDSGGNTDSATYYPTVLPIPLIPMIDLIKSIKEVQDENSNSITDPGDIVEYEFTVTNTGNTRLGELTVTDTKITGVSCMATTLEIGGSTTCSGSYILTQADVDLGAVENRANVMGVPIDEVGDTLVNRITGVPLTNVVDTSDAGTPPQQLEPGDTPSEISMPSTTETDNPLGENVNDPSDPEDDPTTLLITPMPGIELLKSSSDLTNNNGDDLTGAGDTIYYTFELINTGNVTLDNIDITDDLLSEPIVCMTTILAAGSSTLCTSKYVVLQSDMDNGEIVNSAIVMGMSPTDAVVVDTSDTNNGGDPRQTIGDKDSTTTVLPIDISMTFDKVVIDSLDEDGSMDLSVGDSIIYELIAINDGNVTLTNVVVTDTLNDPDDIEICLEVSPGDSCVLEVRYEITAADVTAGRIENTGTAVSDDTELLTDMEVVVLPNPSFTIIKSDPVLSDDFDGSADAGEGDSLEYTITVLNNGTANLTNVVVHDPLLTPSSNTCDFLEPLSSCVLTGKYEVTAADLQTEFTNIATAVSDQVGPMEDSAAVDIPFPAMTLKKSSPSLVEVLPANGFPNIGDTLYYDVELSNTGTAILTNVSITDLGLTPDSNDCGTLAPTEKCVLQGYHIVEAADVGGEVENIATAQSDQTPDVADTTKIKIQNPAIDLVKSSPDLVDKDGSGDISAGDTLYYTITATNVGNILLEDVYVVDTLLTPDTMYCAALDTLGGAPPNVCILEGYYEVQESDLGTTLKNVAEVFTETDPQLIEKDSVFVIIPSPGLNVVKILDGIVDKDEDNQISIGDTLFYNITATNTGGSNLTNVFVSDPLLTPMDRTCAGPLAPLDNCVLNGYLVIDQDLVDNGIVQNIATATADQGVMSIDSTENEIPQTPSIAIVKSSVLSFNGDGEANVGDTIYYTYVVTNIGNTTLNNVDVTESSLDFTGTGTLPVPEFESNTMGSTNDTLQVGESATYGAFYLLTEEDIDNGRIDNQAVATASDPMGNGVADDSDSDNPADPNETGDQGSTEEDDPTATLIPASASIDIIKYLVGVTDSNNDGIVGLGDLVEYAFTVENTGNVTLRNVEVNDLSTTVLGGPIYILQADESDSQTFTATYVIVQSDIDRGGIENVATTEGTPPNNPDGSPMPMVRDSSDTGTEPTRDDATPAEVDDPENTENPNFDGSVDLDSTNDPTVLYITPMPKLELVKSVKNITDTNGNGITDAGDVINYTFAVHNTGNTALADITVNDPLLVAPNGSLNGGPISLAVGASDTNTFTGTYTIQQNDVDAGGIENVADATGDPVATDPITGDPLPDSPLVNPDGSDIEDVTDKSDTGTDSEGEPIPDDPNDPDDGPENIETYNPLDENSNDPNDSGDDPTTILFDPVPMIELVKSVKDITDTNGNGITDAGDVINYTFEVHNTGNTALADIMVNDPLLVAPNGSLVGGTISLAIRASDTTTFTGMYTIQQNDVSSGGVENVATTTGDPVATDAITGAPIPNMPLMNSDGSDIEDVTDISDAGSSPDGTPIMEPENTETDNPMEENANDETNPGDDPTTILIDPTPRLQLLKSVASVTDMNGNGVSDVGDVVRFEFEVINVGNTAVADITISDDLLVNPHGELHGGPIALAVGARDAATFYGLYTIQEKDLELGGIENIAYVSGDPVQSDANGAPIVDSPLQNADGSDIPNVVDQSDAGVEPEVWYPGDLPNVIADPEGVNTQSPMGIFVNSPATGDDPTTILLIQCPSIACNNNLQISLDASCGGITPNAMLEGSYPGSFIIEITDENGKITQGFADDETAEFTDEDGDPLDWSSFIGQTINYKIIARCNENSCWGTATIESNILPNISDQPCANFVSSFELDGSLKNGEEVLVMSADQISIANGIALQTGKDATILFNNEPISLTAGTLSGIAVTKVAVAVSDQYPTGWANVRCDWSLVLNANGDLMATSELIDVDNSMPFDGQLAAPDADFACDYHIEFKGCYECTTWCDGNDGLGDKAQQILANGQSMEVELYNREEVLDILTGACAPEIRHLEAQIIETGDLCGGSKIVNWIAEIEVHGKKETQIIFSQAFEVQPIELFTNSVMNTYLSPDYGANAEQRDALIQSLEEHQVIQLPNHAELSCGDDYSATEDGAGQIMYLNRHQDSDSVCIEMDLHYTIVDKMEDRKILIGNNWVIVPVVTKLTETKSYCVEDTSDLRSIINFLKRFPDYSDSDQIDASLEIGSLSKVISFEAIPGAIASESSAIDISRELVDSLEMDIENWKTAAAKYYDNGKPYVLESISDGYCNIKVSSSDSDPIEICGGGKKIFRTWTIVDWCTGLDKEHVQIIEVADNEKPTIVTDIDELNTYLAKNHISISPWTCEADLSIIADLVTFEDNCASADDITKSASVAGHLNSVGVGTYTVIVTGTDECGNASSVELTVIVDDQVPPTPVCQDEVEATLASDPNKAEGGVAKVYAEAFDAGSHDAGCGNVTPCVARMEDLTTPVTNCDGEVVGYEPVTCGAQETALKVDLGVADSKGNCVYDGKTNIAYITNPCAPFVKFCCEDVGGENMVRVTFTDDSKNTNICMVPVTVVDKSAADCTDSQVTITCVDNIDDKVKGPSVRNNSCGSTFVYTDSGKVDGCGQGTIVRSWYTDEDVSGDFTEGDTYKCVTEVTVIAAGGFDPYSIKWPKHYDDGVVAGINLECGDEDSNNDVVSTEKSDIAMGNSFNCVPDADAIAPVWCEYNCGLIAYEYQDDTLTASDACLKILRRWTVIDWCAYEANGNQNGDDDNDTARDEFEAVEDWAQGECSSCEIDGRPDRDDNVYFRYKKDEVDEDGYYTFDQVIKVVDDTAPEIDVVDTMYVDIVGGKKSAEDGAECFATGSVTATAEDFCGGEMYSADGLVWNVTRKVGGSTVAFKREVGGSVTMGTGEGTDGDEAVIDWVVKDGCGNATTGRTIVIFRDNKAPTPVCIAGLTTAVMPVGGTVAIWAKDYDRGSFDNCTATDDLVFAIVRRGEDLDLDAAIAGELTGKEYTCEDLGNSNADQLDVYVIDAHGNHDFCTVSIIIEDNEGVCGDPENGSVALISGSVSNENGDMVEAATVTVNANLAEYPRTYVTESNGQYAFNNAEMNADYELSVEKADTYGTGVSTADLVLIQKHLLGLRDLDSPYKVIAADANGSGSVTTADIAELRRVILGLKSDLANAPAWRFVDASQDLSADPFTYSENIAIADLASNMTNQNFVATKTGDVNVSANTLETRANGMVSLTTAEVEFEAGQRVEVPVSGANFADVVGYQLTMNHAGLELIDVKAGAIAMGIENVGQFEEALTMSWNNASGVSTDEVLFTLVFNARTAGSLAESLSVTDKVTVSEAYVGEDLERKLVSLSIGSETSIETAQYALHQNEPNPFADQTKIGFVLPESGRASLTVYDVTGQIVLELVDDYGAGYNEMRIEKTQLQVNGILYYQLQSGEYTATKKMVKLE